jgi:N-acetyl-anhydromuramoyl-L-alanine amidase
MLENEMVDGWLKTAEKHPSPHFFELPEREISLLVIHCISLPPHQFGGPYIDQFFTGTLDPKIHPYFEQISNMRVSAHLLIDRQGKLKQYVPFTKCAHHAGESVFRGRPRCNEFSIGIELEGAENIPFEDVQYSRLIEVIKILQKKWPALNSERIVGHSEIAPSRKSDPGPFFEWERLIRGIE